MSGMEVQDDWNQDGNGMNAENEPQYQQDLYDQQQQYHHQQQQENVYVHSNELLDLDGTGNEGGAEEGDEEVEELDLQQQQHPHSQQQDEVNGRLLMRFCPHDSSMLYPKEHKRSRTLRYACRLCRYSEEATMPLIYRNIIKKEVGNVLHTVPGAVSDDPTLPRSHNASCENCGNTEAVFFQSDTGQSDSLALIFVCCNCDHKWVA